MAKISADLVLLITFVPASANAEPVTTTVAGTLNRSQENGCVAVSAFFYKVDCSYENARKTIGSEPIPWVGPTANAIYYRPDSPEALLPYVPTPGDARIEPTLTGTLIIDTANTPAGDDDTISGTFIVGPATRTVVTRAMGKNMVLRAIESWSGITHVLPATRVTTAARNPAGGFDYVIGARGMPDRLCRKNDPQDCFPSAEAAFTTDGKWGQGTWAAPGKLPVGRSPALGGNPGAHTTAVISGYRCIDNTGGVECTGGVTLWGSRQEDPGFDNLLLREATIRSSHISRRSSAASRAAPQHRAPKVCRGS